MQEHLVRKIDFNSYSLENDKYTRRKPILIKTNNISCNAT